VSFKVGIDVGGTFTDFLVTRADGEPVVFKTSSTPKDPSIGLVEGLRGIADSLGMALDRFMAETDVIVHGTTVTTNATLTRTGAKTGLITTDGVRDALEMRRGIREEQYNNRYTNVPPLVPRYLRCPVRGRLERKGREIAALNLSDVEAAIELYRKEGIEAVAICFMNAFANPAHEQTAAAAVRRAMPDAYLTVSSDLLPSVRFYNRVSTTVLNSYVGPKLDRYLASLTERLADIGFQGALLIMQSNGGVVLPEMARKSAAMTLLSGPAAGPIAGLGYAEAHGNRNCLTVDMGGTSFDVAMVLNGAPITANEGEINRYRIAMPMLDIVTIGAGGGSIGWIDEGGLLRMGPHSAGADPGPVCYGRGGTLPACTDADLVLGYLDPDYFAGGKIKLDLDGARAAIEHHIAGPLGLPLDEAALGMYRVINANMAQGVREITIKRGFDPREFPMVVAGGAGPVHGCMIGRELELPLLIVPRESSIFCAAGMLMSDLRHDFVRSFVGRVDEGLGTTDWPRLERLVDEMIAEGNRQLEAERIPAPRRQYVLTLDCRYVKQYHEVSFDIPLEAIRRRDPRKIKERFHAEHNRLYGYSLEEQGTAVELINVRVQCVGLTDKPAYAKEAFDGTDARHALKGERRIVIPETGKPKTVPVYDGHKTRHGNRIAGPALIEQENTTTLVAGGYDCVCDEHGSFVLYTKGRTELLKGALAKAKPAAKTPVRKKLERVRA
jgi:N-methylhydantoinase A